MSAGKICDPMDLSEDGVRDALLALHALEYRTFGTGDEELILELHVAHARSEAKTDEGPSNTVIGRRGRIAGLELEMRRRMENESGRCHR